MNSYSLVSVIVPVYNAEGTLQRTLTALRSQTYRLIEIIFVNDCSTDQSLYLLEQFAASTRAEGVIVCKVISHQRNQGVSVARNTGLEHATGELICYVDADDSIQADAIERCVVQLQQSGADIVYFHWRLSFDEFERKMQQPYCATPLDAIKAMLAGTMRWNLWLFMARRKLYEVNMIRFIPGANMGEDLLVTIKLLVNAHKISLLDRYLYSYKKDNTESLTRTYSQKHMREVEININAVADYLKTSRFRNDIGLGIDFLKLNIKLPLLVTGSRGDYMCWTEWFSASDKYVLRNKKLPMRTRLLQWFAWKRQFWVVKLYYAVILRFVYGVLYK